jgi:hypothetical protein
MKTPVWPLIIALIFPFTISFAQTPGKYVMKFYDHHYNLAVNKNEQLSIATYSGEIAFANSINGNWYKTFVDKTVGGPTDRVRINNTCYFNTDTAFVSGVIYNDENRVEDIYHTVDGGKSWRCVQFGFEGPVDDAAFLDNGEAWLSVGYRDIAYTKDYGLTWARLAIPVDTSDKNHRFSRIYFNYKRAGIIGSHRNKLAYTNDNCKHWTIIPTPFSEGKCKKIIDPDNNDDKDDNAMPINRVAIFKDYLLVKQEGRVFYSNLHKVQWVPLPEYKDFYTDAENSALFFERNRKGFVKCDSELKPVCSFDSIGNSYSIICKNGSLYVLGRDKIWQINTSNQLVESPLNSNVNLATREPVSFGHTFTNTSYLVGHIGNQIYLGKEYKWLYAFTLPFATDSGTLCMKDEDVILFSRGDSVFYYSISGRKLSKGNGAKEIRDFVADGIHSIVFIRGFGTCFGVGKENMIYTLQDNQFVLARRNTEGSRQDIFSRNCPDTINQRKVAEFVQKIPAIYSKQMCVDEMRFSQEEYDTCNRNILKYKSLYEGGQKEGEYPFTFEKGNLDFTKLITLVDSVKTINPELLNWYFITQKNNSTIHYRFTMKLVNNKGEELEIKNEDYYSNGFYCPWQINLNSLHSVSTAIEINRFIRDVYPGFLRNEKRIDLIQELAKLLYREWE